jgi:uncharacterized protein (UPF0332 family)
VEDRSIIELSKYRFDKALSNIEIAKKLYGTGDYEVALNRAYYSAFDAMRAVNALDGFDSSKHSGVISNFNHMYVKTGIFPASTSSIIRDASILREKSDYEDFYEADEDETSDIISSIESFLRNVENYLRSKSVIE